jgi:membrane peptidoglycan carboxypeptidase
MSARRREERRDKRAARKKRPRFQRIILRIGWLIPITALFIGAGVLVFTYAFATIPLPREVPLDAATRVYDKDGDLIGIYTGEQRRFLLNDKKLSQLFKKKPFIGNAVIAAEDKDFYQHNGVSLRGLARAAWANLTGGEIQQGGSTISQQYVKNAVLRDPSRTFTRKFKEAVLAIKLERRYSKKQILGFYLNTIYLGRGAYGIQAAAKAYFGKTAMDLTLPEAAYLAAIIPSPESYQPDEKMAAAVAQRNAVLDTMAEEGLIRDRRARKAKHGKVDVSDGIRTDIKHQRAAYFMEWLRDEYLDPMLGSCLYTCGLKIYTTLDLDAQSAAEAALQMSSPKDWPQAALVSMTSEGDVRAMVGGKCFSPKNCRFDSVKRARGFNYASTTPGRQPGSSFKPYTLLTAIEEGVDPAKSYFSGASPVTIEDEECGIPPWQPENYGGSSYGTVNLVTATQNSINTVFAQLIAEIGPQDVADLLERFDFRPAPGTDSIKPRCSLALGGYIDITPVEQARGFAGFAARGYLPEVNPVRHIKDNDGSCISDTGPATIEAALREARKQQGVVPKVWADCDKPITPRGDLAIDEPNSADVLNQVMTGVTSGTAASANLSNYLYEESGKTGTTQESRDAWFAGSVAPTENSPGLTTVVWMGYPYEKGKKGQPGYTPLMSACYDPAIPNKCRPVEGITVTGGSFPAQMWAAYMNQAVEVLEIPAAQWRTPEDLPDRKIGSSPPPPSPTFEPAPPETTEEEEPTPKESEKPKPPKPPEPPNPPPSSKPPPSSEPPPPPTSEPPPTPNNAGGNGGNNDGGNGGGDAASLGMTGLLLLLSPILMWRRSRRRGGAR